MPSKKLYGAAAAAVEKKTVSSKQKYLSEHELILIGEKEYKNVPGGTLVTGQAKYVNAPAGTTDAMLKKMKKEARARKRRQEREEELIAFVTEKPSPADYAITALIRGRAAIAKALTPGDLKKEKIDPEDAMRIQRTRTDRAMTQDRCQQNKVKVTQPDLDWVLNPGKKDVPGIDAPGYCYKRKSGKVVCVQKRKSKFPKTCGGKKK